MKKLFFTFFAVLLFLPIPTDAATFKGGENVYIDKQITDDLYVGGKNLNIQRNVNGDVLANILDIF